MAKCNHEGLEVSAHDNDRQNDETERLLADFFRRERPAAWPEPPWRGHMSRGRPSGSLRARSVLVAALVLAAVGLSSLGELPSTWPGPRDGFTRGKMEANRSPAATKKTPLPGFRVPEPPKADQPVRR